MYKNVLAGRKLGKDRYRVSTETRGPVQPARSENDRISGPSPPVLGFRARHPLDMEEWIEECGELRLLPLMNAPKNGPLQVRPVSF